MRVAAFVFAALVALLPAVALAHGGTEVNVRGEVRPDGPIEITGEDFAPEDNVRIELRRAGIVPIELARVSSDQDGTFSASVHVPAEVKAGLYQLAAEGEESATTEVTILGAASGSAPGQPGQPEPPSAGSVSNDRKAGEVAGLAAFTAAVALLSLGLLRLSRTRPRVTGAYAKE